jgi:reactive intermediate/imine deaminase
VAALGKARKPVETDEAPAPVGPYSQALAAGGVLYLSGQVPLEPATGELVEGGIAEQTRRCLDSLDALCRAGGSRLQHAARLTIYLTDLSLFGEVNEVYSEYFEEPYPVRTTVEVSGLPKGSLVEIDAIVPLTDATV